jgi:hypothetical protein
MNLRNEFAKILEKYGYPVLVVRQDKKLRCSCWSEKTQESDRKCPRCFGLGWNPIVEKYITRTEDMTVPETLARVTVTGSFGQIAVPSRAYFFQHNVKISEKDLIVDVEWSKTGKPIYNGGGIYEVSHVDGTLRLEKGETVFKKASCKDTPVQKNIRGIRIVQVNGIVNYELAMEDV